MNSLHRIRSNHSLRQLTLYFIFMIVGSYITVLIFASYTGRLLWADGAFYLYNILENRTVYIHPYHLVRMGADILWQFPAVALVRSGVSNTGMIQFVFSAMYYLGIPGLSLLASYRAVRHTEPSLIVLPLFSHVVAASSTFGFATEITIGQAAFWPVFLQILFGRDPRFIDYLFVLLFSLVLSSSYQLCSILAFMCAAGILIRFRVLAEQNIWFWACVFLILSIGIVSLSLSALIHAGAQYAAGNFLESIVLAISPLTIFSSAVVIVLAIGSLGYVQRTRVLSPYLEGGLLLGLLIAGVYAAASIVTPYNEFLARTFLVPITIALAGVGGLAYARIINSTYFRSNFVLGSLAITLIVYTMFHARQSFYWSQYATLIRISLAIESGVVPYDKTILGRDLAEPTFSRAKMFTHPWHLPFLSAILSPSRQVRTIIENVDPKFNYPFSPDRPESLSFHDYGAVIPSRYFDYSLMFAPRK